MHSAFVNINGVPTRVTTWGKWIEEDFDVNEPKDIVVCIPGNPGFVGFYDQFLRTIHDTTGWPVWIVGHAGHELPQNNELYDIPSPNEHPQLYNLDGQIEHKIKFFEQYVPDNARLHLIGHSVGTYIICQLLKRDFIKEKIINAHLLFPTIEYIADTPNGKFYTNILQRIQFLILFFAWIFSNLPNILQTILIYVYMFIMRIEKSHLNTLISFINPKTLKNVFFMADDEMLNIKTRDTDVLSANLDKVRVYYGKTDGWGPVSYYTKLKRDIPLINAEVCKRGFSHAFVLHNSKATATMISNWLEESKNRAF